MIKIPINRLFVNKESMKAEMLDEIKITMKDDGRTFSFFDSYTTTVVRIPKRDTAAPIFAIDIIKPSSP